MELDEIDERIYEKRLEKLEHLPVEALRELVLDAIAEHKQYQHHKDERERLAFFVMDFGGKELFAKLDDIVVE